MGRAVQGELVEAVSRALALLDAFTIEDVSLRLTEMARRAGLPKSSTLRLARTLAASGYLATTEEGTWRLGPSAAWLGARYQVGFDIHQSIGPEMQVLANATRRSVSYFVRRPRAGKAAARSGTFGSGHQPRSRRRAHAARSRVARSGLARFCRSGWSAL